MSAAAIPNDTPLTSTPKAIHAMAERRYKVVPITEKTTDEKITDLRAHLAFNVNVNLENNDLEMAAVYQERLDLFELLVANFRVSTV